MVGLETAMVLVGVWFSMLMYYDERIMRFKVLLEVQSSAILDLVGSNQFLSCPMSMSHSFKGCTLPPSLPFQ